MLEFLDREGLGIYVQWASYTPDPSRKDENVSSVREHQLQYSDNHTPGTILGNQRRASYARCVTWENSSSDFTQATVLPCEWFESATATACRSRFDRG